MSPFSLMDAAHKKQNDYFFLNQIRLVASVPLWFFGRTKVGLTDQREYLSWRYFFKILICMEKLLPYG